MTQQITTLRGTFHVDDKGADSHKAVLTWAHSNPDKECVTTMLYPFTFNCEIHVHLCDSMECPCVCINYLFEHYRNNKLKSIFCHLLIRVQTEIKEDPIFCQRLFYPVFYTANGRSIINNRQIQNNGRQNLLVEYPSTQQELGTPIKHVLKQPRKTNNINNKGARIRGNGEVPGGNTTSPNQAIHQRAGRRFANDITYSVCVESLMTKPAIRVLADDSEEHSLRDNLDLSGEDGDQQLLSEPIADNILTQDFFNQQQLNGEPIAENVLPQDNLNEIGNTDDVVNKISVSKEDGPSTPPLGECMDYLAEVNEQQRLMTTQEHHTPVTQEADVLMTEDELILMNIPQLPT